jgi:hypothetical protein
MIYSLREIYFNKATFFYSYSSPMEKFKQSLNHLKLIIIILINRKMKRIILTIAVTSFLVGAIFTGCNSATPKEEAAQENLQDAKQEPFSQ